MWALVRDHVHKGLRDAATASFVTAVVQIWLLICLHFGNQLNQGKHCEECTKKNITMQAAFNQPILHTTLLETFYEQKCYS